MITADHRKEEQACFSIESNRTLPATFVRFAQQGGEMISEIISFAQRDISVLVCFCFCCFVVFSEEATNSSHKPIGCEDLTFGRGSDTAYPLQRTHEGDCYCFSNKSCRDVQQPGTQIEI